MVIAHRCPSAGRTAIIVDDGIATGGTARAALRVARGHGAAQVVLAVPVAPSDSVRELSRGRRRSDLRRDTRTLLRRRAVLRRFHAGSGRTGRGAPGRGARDDSGGGRPVGDDPPVDPRDEDVELRDDSLRLFGHLTVPPNASGLVLFAHGSGSSRHSPRNRYVAQILNRERIATLLFDLLAVDEELDRRNVFDIELLADRLTAATTWAEREEPGLPIGYFGASTGAAAALWAAADPEVTVNAVVSRGGRPDLAIPASPRCAHPRC